MSRISKFVGLACLLFAFSLGTEPAQALCLAQDMEGTWLRTSGDAGSPNSIKISFSCPDVVSCPAGQPCSRPEPETYVEYFSGPGQVSSGQVVANKEFLDSASHQTTRADAVFPGTPVRELLLLRWSADELIGFLSVYPAGTSSGASYIGRYERKVVPLSLSFSPSPVNAGDSATGTVTLTGVAPPSGAEVSLSSSKPNIASVPASVTVPPGSPTQSFSVTTNAATCPQGVQINASRAGTTVSGVLTISSVNQRPSAPAGFRLFPFKFGGVILFWNSMAGIEKFILERTRTDTGSVRIWEIASDQTYFRAPAQTPCVGYAYRLRAFANMCMSMPAGPIPYVYNDGSCPIR